MIFENFPYTNFHDINLDWILKTLREMESEIQDFVFMNTIKYADPIQWNITSQYAKNTIVIDPATGDAYISNKPVPAGVLLSNSDYWSVIFNYQAVVNKIMENVATDAGDSPTIPVTLTKGDLVWWNNDIYILLTDMAAGTAFVPGTNVEKYTVDHKINDIIGSVGTISGDVETIQGDIETINGSIQSINDDMLLLDGKIDTTAEELNDRIDDVEATALASTVASLTCVGLKTTTTDHSEHPGNAFNIIQTKSGKTIIVDCGWEYTEATCREIFNNLGITKLDLLILTHYHADHLGNLENILNILDVSDLTAYIPSAPSAQWDSGNVRSKYDSVYALLNGVGANIIYPIDKEYEVDRSIKLTFRNCSNDAYFLTQGTDTNTYNNTSRCCYVSVDDTVILFTGDLEPMGAEYIADTMLSASLVQMPHHGYGREYPDSFYENVKAGAWFVNNANGDGGDGNDLPRYWNNFYTQATKENKPVFCTSNAAGYDLVLLIGGQIASETSPAYHKNAEHFGKGRYTNLSLATKTGYSELMAGSYVDMIKKLPGNVEVYAVSASKVLPTPSSAMSYIINVSNSGSYQDTFEGQRFVVNQWQKYNGGASGTVYSHYYEDSDDAVHFVQNRSMGNCYRLRIDNLANNATGTPSLTANHGSDVDPATVSLRRKLVLALVNVHLTFAAAPAGGDVHIRTGGNDNDYIYFAPNVRWQSISRVLYNMEPGAIEIKNEAGATITSGFIHIIPIAYEIINESSWPLS